MIIVIICLVILACLAARPHKDDDIRHLIKIDKRVKEDVKRSKRGDR